VRRCEWQCVAVRKAVCGSAALCGSVRQCSNAANSLLHHQSMMRCRWGHAMLHTSPYIIINQRRDAEWRKNEGGAAASCGDGKQGDARTEGDGCCMRCIFILML
jgi:hypothetical protein